MKKVKIILLTHGNWGKELKVSAEMITGKIDSCSTIGLMPEDSMAEYMSRLDIEIYDEKEVLLLADMKGGTPANIASIYAKRKTNVYAICGLSMEMLLSADYYRGKYYGMELVNAVIKDVKEKVNDLK